jgi:hypothetical protein
VAHRAVAPTPTSTHSTVGRADARADGTHLLLHDGRSVRLGVLPDPTGTRRVGRVLRRVERVDVTIDDAGVRAAVTGVGHRRRRCVPVALRTALSLTCAGVPTGVTLGVPVREATER